MRFGEVWFVCDIYDEIVRNVVKKKLQIKFSTRIFRSLLRPQDQFPRGHPKELDPFFSVFIFIISIRFCLNT